MDMHWLKIQFSQFGDNHDKIVSCHRAQVILNVVRCVYMVGYGYRLFQGTNIVVILLLQRSIKLSHKLKFNMCTWPFQIQTWQTLETWHCLEMVMDFLNFSRIGSILIKHWSCSWLAQLDITIKADTRTWSDKMARLFDNMYVLGKARKFWLMVSAVMVKDAWLTQYIWLHCKFGILHRKGIQYAMQG